MEYSNESIPSRPGTADLADALTTVGKYAKTSKYKFANWNIKLPKTSTKLPDSAFKNLSRAAQFFREGRYSLQDIKDIQEKARKAAEVADKANKDLGGIGKTANEAKKNLDKLLEKVPGKGTSR